MSKIDTQGMSGPADPNFKGSAGQKQYKPLKVIPKRLITEQYAKELSILINEVLDQREGNMNYDSYFDIKKFEHCVGEEEPNYKS